MNELKWILFTIFSAVSIACSSQKVRLNPLLPEYLVQGDHTEFKIQLSNLSDSEMTGQVQLELIDTETNQSVDGWLMNTFPNQYFTLASQQSDIIQFPIQIPQQFNRTLKWRVSVSDKKTTLLKEEAILPVYENRISYFENYSFSIADTLTHLISINKLQKSTSVENIENRSMQFEVACNPLWIALNTLSSLDEDDSVINAREINTLKEANRLFAYCVANKINTNISSAQIFEGKDLNELSTTVYKYFLKPWQLQNGSFTWIIRGKEDLFATIYIITQLERLNKLNATPEYLKESLNTMVNKAIEYCDTSILGKSKISEFAYVADYIYMRSYFKDATANKNYVHLCTMAKKEMNLPGKFTEEKKIKIAIAFARNGDKQLASQLFNKYKKFRSALLLELAHEANVNENEIDPIVVDLLKQKQSNSWPTSFQTVDACYALLLNFNNASDCESLIHIKTGSIEIYNTRPDQNDNLSYFKKVIDGRFIKPEMGKILLGIQNFKQHQKKSYASINWEYYDETKASEKSSELQIKKTLLNSKSEKLSEVHTGDTVIVRIELTAAKDIDRIEIKDIPPAAADYKNIMALRPQGVSNFNFFAGNNHIKIFIPTLPKGQQIIQYKFIAGYSGLFNNGITTAIYPSAKQTIKFVSNDTITVE
jgi:hypothetical protein